MRHRTSCVVLRRCPPECNKANAFVVNAEEDVVDKYAEYLRVSHASLTHTYDELKSIIEKLEKELMLGTERYTMDIDEKTARIAEIDHRLSVLRGKGVL